MVLFGQSGCFLGKLCGIRQKCGCIRANVVVFEKMRNNSDKVVVFGQKWLNLGKSG